jgi:predicted transcriptional regulator
MVLPEISQIKNKREKMGLSLSKFAKKYNVDKSWLHSVERKKITPSYTKVKDLFDKFESEKYVEQQTAEELCIRHEKFKKSTDTIKTQYMIYCEIGDLILDVKEEMKKYEISQIPVLKKNYCIGMITDKLVMNLTIDSNLSHLKIHPDMIKDEISPIAIPAQTQLNTIRHILDFSPYVIVTKDENIYGILVRQDVIEKIKK